MFRQFWADESGATAIEYGLIAALIAVGIITAVGTLGETLTAMFENVNEKLNNEPADPAP